LVRSAVERAAAGRPVALAELSPKAAAVHRAAHTALARATADFADFKFNTAIAAMMELINVISLDAQDEPALAGPGTDRGLAMGEALRLLTLMLAPVAPHVCEEVWQRAGGGGTLFRVGLPEADAAALVADMELIVVQVNGKLRAKLELPAGMDQAAVEREARENAKIQSLLEGKQVRKVIYVPHKLVNIVAG